MLLPTVLLRACLAVGYPPILCSSPLITFWITLASGAGVGAVARARETGNGRLLRAAAVMAGHLVGLIACRTARRRFASVARCQVLAHCGDVFADLGHGFS